MPYRNKTQIGLKIKRMRLEGSITQEVLAERSGVPRPHLSNIENARTSPEMKTLEVILMKGFNMPYNKAKDLIAEWEIEESLSKSDDPEKVLKNVTNTIQGDNSISVVGDGNTVNKG